MGRPDRAGLGLGGGGPPLWARLPEPGTPLHHDQRRSGRVPSPWLEPARWVGPTALGLASGGWAAGAGRSLALVLLVAQGGGVLVVEVP